MARAVKKQRLDETKVERLGVGEVIERFPMGADPNLDAVPPMETPDAAQVKMPAAGWVTPAMDSKPEFVENIKTVAMFESVEKGEEVIEPGVERRAVNFEQPDSQIDSADVPNVLPAASLPIPQDRPMLAFQPAVREGETLELVGEPIGSVIPDLVNLEPDEKMVRLFIRKEALELLWKQADKLQHQVTEEIHNLKLANAHLARIQNARNYLLAGEGNYEEAARSLAEVEHRLVFNKRVMAQTRERAPILFAYQLLWLIAIGYFVWIMNYGALADLGNLMIIGVVSVYQFLSSLAWGALGAVVGGIYALWKHVSDLQDFDSQYTLWYITNPILGVVLGAFVFLVIQAGFFSMTSGVNTDQPIQSAMIIYVLAWIAGFKQNVVYQIVQRILDVFQVNEKKEQ